jgi:prepilin-type N-terminal cleavage/methylation domain-containing protein
MGRSHSKSHGFTLVELMIVVAVIGVIVGGGMYVFRSCQSNTDTAEAEAMTYSKKLGLEVVGVSCTDQDSDNDGYVSCSVSHRENGKLTIQPVECAKKWSTNSGCRAPKLFGMGVR